MREISERVAQGEGFLVTKNSKVIFEIKPRIKESNQNLPIIANKKEIIKKLQAEIDTKLEEIAVLNQHIKFLMEDDD